MEVLKEILKGLATKPEYVLLFGIIFVVVVSAQALPDTTVLPIFLVSVIAAVIIILFAAGKSESKLEKISEKLLAQSLQLESLNKNGILKIYSDREEYLSGDFLNDMRGAIDEASKKADERVKLRMIGISLRELFLDDYMKDYNPFLTYLQPKQKGERDLPIDIEVLVLNKESEQAGIRKRSDCYKHYGTCESNLYPDLDNLRDFYRIWKDNESSHKVTLNIRAYKASSACFMIILYSRNYVVVEQYHSGGFGGRIPLIKYELKSSPGVKFNDHFEFIWEKENGLTTCPLLDVKGSDLS